jgi:prepilin-type N-terminal cleavage/methylation domain-containing protein
MKLQIRIRDSQETGMSLIELLLAMAVLATGMCALLVLFLDASYSNSRNGKDTSSTLLAQMVLEQISAQHPNSTATIVIADCVGTQWTVATAGGAAPNGAGANLITTSSTPGYGGIDQSQAIASITQYYAMQYTDCDTGGHQTKYDVRWNVMTVSANTTRLITVSARQFNSPTSQLGGVRFAVPVNLRGIGGP